MQTTNELLDRIKTNGQIASDYKLAQVLGVTKNAITNYRYGKSRPNDEIGLRMAILLNEDAGHITACLHAERAQTADVRALWERVAERLSSAPRAVAGFARISLLVAVFAIGLIASQAVNATTTGAIAAPSLVSSLYIMLSN